MKSASDYKILKAELKENPFRTLNVAFLAMSVIPLLTVVYLIVGKYQMYEMVIGTNGILFLACLILSVSGLITAYLMLKKIITKMLQYCSERREAEELKNSVITEISHGFYTPINAIQANIDNIKQKAAGENLNNQNQMLDACHFALKDLNQLVNSLLDVSRTKIVKIGIKRELIDLNLIMEEEISMARPAAKLADKFIFYSKGDKYLSVWGDKDKLRRAIFNLLHSIVRQTPNGGQIQILLNADEETAELKFANTGEQIQRDEISRVFDKFANVKQPYGEDSDVDLSIAKEIIDLHKGRIEAFGRITGGIGFHMILPRDLRTR